jgi:hypothetical protein
MAASSGVWFCSRERARAVKARVGFMTQVGIQARPVSAITRARDAVHDTKELW